MSEKVYVLNVYNTMTGQYELIQVTNAWSTMTPSSVRW